MLRDYQLAINSNIVNSWQNNNRMVCAVMPTGAGKTVCMSNLFKQLNVPSMAIAHRDFLVLQISCALAAAGLKHQIIAPNKTIKFIVEEHIEQFGQSYWSSTSPLHVAGIDTLIRREVPFAAQIRLVQIDEGHHVVEGNKWHRGLSMFPNAFGVGWTATPERADGKPLDTYSDLIIGPAMRELIDRGYLCEYVIFGPREAIDTRDIKITRSGDFSPDKLREAAHNSSTITGDIVKHYLKYAAGKNGVTFAVDVELAQEHAAAFRQAGVPAVVLHANSKDHERTRALKDFKSGLIKQIVNVDILGEGFDVPMIEVASFARPTQSYGLYVQQFGRALRILKGKPVGTIIDHVGNVARHGLPDSRTEWSLEGRTKVQTSREMPIRTCPACFRVFESWGNACLYCGHRPEPQGRDKPELVEGDLTEYTPDLLARLGREARKAVALPHTPARSARDHVVHAQMVNRKNAQDRLREAIAYWAGFKRDRVGNSDSVSYREFYHKFGVDVATAQTLGAKDAEKLMDRVRRDAGIL